MSKKFSKKIILMLFLFSLTITQEPQLAAEAPKPVEVVDAEEPVAEAPKPVEVVDTEEPVAEAPKPVEVVDAEEPVAEAPKPVEVVDAEEPVAEAPKPVEVVAAEEPVAEAPKPVEVVATEEPVAEAPKPVEVVDAEEPLEPIEAPQNLEELDSEIKAVEEEIALQKAGEFVPEDLAANEAALAALKKRREELVIVQPVEEVELEGPEIVEPTKVASTEKNVWRDADVEKQFKNLGYAAAVIFFVSMAIGLFGLFYYCPCLTDRSFYDFYYQKFLQTFLMAQYIAFWLLYNADLPRNLHAFLRGFFRWTVQWHNIFSNRAETNHGDIFYKNEFQRYFDEDVSNQFVISFGFVLLIQGIVLVIALIIWIINKGKQNKLNAENYNELSQDERIAIKNAATSSERFNNHFWAKLVYTVFMMFIIETLVFAIYNFYRDHWSIKDARILEFSFALAIIWIIIIALLWFLNLAKAAKSEQDLLEHSHDGTWGFITRGLEYSSPARKFFQGIQYLVYGLFAIVLVVAYEKSKVQSSINYVIFALFAFYVIGIRPANTSFWKLEQTGVHILLLIAKTFLFAIVIDDHHSLQNMSAKQAWILGYFVVIFAFLVLIWNLLVLLWKLFEHMKKCKDARAGKTGFNMVRPHMKVDNDEEMDIEMANNLFTDVQRRVVEREVKEESVPSYIQKDFDTRKARFYRDVESKPVLKGFNLVNDVQNSGKIVEENVDNLGQQTTTYVNKNLDNLGGQTTTVVKNNLGNIQEGVNNKKSMGDFAKDFMRNDNN